MQSIATKHFPQVITEGKKKWLFNPILKKRFANRPEERVRLRWVEYLLHQSDWKKSRIGFETPVKLRQESNNLRADLILFSEKLTPLVLVECKSEKVSLTPKVAQQAARYNVSVEAQEIVLTNGVNDFWFSRDEQKIQEKNDLFREVNDIDEVRSEPDYWSKRGFCSGQSSEDVMIWLRGVLTGFFDKNNPWSTGYLAFEDSFLNVPMDQYYRIADAKNEFRVAMSFIGSNQSSSYLIAVINKKGSNRGVITIELDLLLNGEPGAFQVFKNGGQNSLELNSNQRSEFITLMENQIQKLPARLMKIFD